MEHEPTTALGRWMKANERDDDSLAQALSITRSQVNRLRRGVSKPSLDTAEALAGITGISALVLLRGGDAPSQDVAA